MKGGKTEALSIPELDALASQVSRYAVWTSEQDAVICRYYGRGRVSPRDIAEAMKQKFGIDRNAGSITRRAYVLRQMGRLGGET